MYENLSDKVSTCCGIPLPKDSKKYSLKPISIIINFIDIFLKALSSYFYWCYCAYLYKTKVFKNTINPTPTIELIKNKLQLLWPGGTRRQDSPTIPPAWWK